MIKDKYFWSLWVIVSSIILVILPTMAGALVNYVVVGPLSWGLWASLGEGFATGWAVVYPALAVLGMIFWGTKRYLKKI